MNGGIVIHHIYVYINSQWAICSLTSGFWPLPPNYISGWRGWFLLLQDAHPWGSATDSKMCRALREISSCRTDDVYDLQKTSRFSTERDTCRCVCHCCMRQGRHWAWQKLCTQCIHEECKWIHCLPQGIMWVSVTSRCSNAVPEILVMSL